MEENLKKLYQSIMEGESEEVELEVRQALTDGTDLQLMLQTMMSAMDEVGRLFQEGEYFVPEMLISARAMQAGMDILKPVLSEHQIAPAGRVCIGTVKGDLHDIGKNLVSMMLEGAGFEVIDLGIDQPVEKFVNAVREYQPDILGLSALLTTTMPAMETVITALNEAGLHQSTRIMVGGAPITADYARLIGADGYAEDAAQAVRVARELVAV
jgi:5-methyltetrahydrofolate--homocysteine methyltransferase